MRHENDCTGLQVVGDIQGFVHNRVAREPLCHIGRNSDDYGVLSRLWLHGQPTALIDRGHSRIQPPHMDRHLSSGLCGDWVFKTAKDKVVYHVSLKVLKLFFPFGRDGRGFYVERAKMRAQRLIQDIGHVESVPFPVGWGTAGLKGYRSVLPHVLNAGTYRPLRIYIQHRNQY